MAGERTRNEGAARGATCILAAFAGLVTASAASAADAPADKSAYTVFDPTPDALLRAFCTDRPTKSTGACTVDAGHVQIESDILNYTTDRSGGVTTTTTFYTDPTLKLGLTNRVDGEVSLVPWQEITSHDRATGERTRARGIGDLFLRLKWNLLGDDGGAVAVALNPYLKLPTARRGVGNGVVEGGLIAPISVTLPANWSLSFDPELDIVENAAGDGRHLNTVNLVGISRPVSKTITLSVELWSDVDFDPAATRTQYSADLGAAFIPKSQPNLQFDTGVNFGLNRVTPDVQAYVGVSRRF